MAEILIALAGSYALGGLAFAIPFAAMGAGAIDPAARGGTLGFRLVIIPGVVALWPLLLCRWLHGGTE